MAVVVPLRVTLAFVGLISGYYAGVILEKRWILNSSIGRLASTLSTMHYIGSTLDEYTDDEDDFDSFYDSVSNSSDVETEYSEEDASLGN
jgi:hypothetical protein